MKVAVVGCGGFGRVHLDALNELRSGGMDIELYVFSRDPEKARECARTYNASGYFTNYDDVVKSNIDVVDLVVSHDAHAPMAIRAMEAGKHVLLEKPIARTLEEANAIVEASRRFNVKFMVAENFYFDPAVWKAVELMPRLGKIYTIIVRSTAYHSPSGWRRIKELMGGGALIDGGIHFIDTLLNLGGDYERACGVSYRSVSGIEGEDTTLGIFKFENGATGLIIYSWGFKNPSRTPAFEVYGDNGSIVENPDTRVKGRVYGDVVFNGEAIQLPRVNVVKLEIESFLKAVESNEPVPMPPEKAIRDLKAVLDIYNNQCI